MAPQGQGVPLLDGEAAVRCHKVRAEELVQESEGLGVAHHLHGGVLSRQGRHVGGVVGLHMGDHQIIGGSAVQGLGQILLPGVGGPGVHRIHDGDFFVQDHIGIVADAGGHRVLALEEIQGGVIHANAQDGIGHFFYAHGKALPSL